MARLLGLLACVAVGAMAHGHRHSGSGDHAQSSETVEVNVNVNINILGYSMGGGSSWVQQNPAVSTGSNPMTHQVTVGGPAGLVYTPCTINAAVGDLVVFTFLAENHTLTQSAFATPCIRLDGGSDSGFMPNPSGSVNPPPQYKLQVMTTSPTWFYCRQKTHCGKGMTFSINPSSTKTNAEFNAAAIAQNGTANAYAVSPPASTAAAQGSSYGSPPAGAYSAPPAAASSPPPASSSPPPAYTPASSPPGSSIVAGSGTSNNGVVSCSCLCGSSSFSPSQGIGAYGGYLGSMPAS